MTARDTALGSPEIEALLRSLSNAQVRRRRSPPLGTADMVLTAMGKRGHGVDVLPSQLEQVLRYVRDWNTNGKLSHVAQAILYTLLRRFTSEDLLALKEIKPVRARMPCRMGPPDPR